MWWHPPTAHTPGEVGFWVVSSHARILEVVSDAAAFSSAGAPGAEGGGTLIEDLPFGFAAGVLLNMMDDPRHQQIRRLVTPAVAPRALALLEGELRRRTAVILEAVADRGRCDFLLEVAVELPLQATAMLMGIPEEDRHDLMAWSSASLTYDDRELGTTSAAVQEASAAMAAYGSAMVERKRAGRGRRHPGHGDRGRHRGRERCRRSLVRSRAADVLQSADRGRERDDAQRHRPGPGRPDRAPRSSGPGCRPIPALVPGAVEEILRWSSATLYNRRTATADVEIGR